jgi:DMSO/TMAO reductase YedYZ molybdopterin-dependent catalytic subunit
MNYKPNWITGALIGALLTAPLLALIFIGQRLALLPFLPQDFFNLVRDNTPGGIIVGTIQAMVDLIIQLNLGRVDEVAKQIETVMAVGMIFIFGIISGVIFFNIFSRLQKPMLNTAGIIGGLGIGIVMGIISLAVGTTSSVDPRWIGALWLAALFVVWGLAHAWVYSKLTHKEKTAAADAQALNRRQFLITVGTASATFTVIGAGLGGLIRRNDVQPLVAAAAPPQDIETLLTELPNAADPVQPAPGTRPEVTPVEDHYRIDIALIPPRIDEATWTLPFVSALGGSEETLAAFTLEEIKAYEMRSDYITMSCISNRIAGDLISTTLWSGVSLQRLLADVPLPETATHLKISAADGFDETVEIATIMNDPRVMLAYYWEGQPLTAEHGFPIRIHVPDLYGMKQPKWITKIEVLDADQDGYWVRRGWDKVARVRATAVIDTIATDMMVVEGETSRVPVGGIAWAGERGISAVEVRIDGGDWQPAQVRSPISDRTWVIWRYDWAFSEGNHTLEVRCIETDGTVQIEEEAGVRPSGATGIHSMEAMI